MTPKSTNTFLAICLGAKDNPRMAEWNAMPEAERNARMQRGMKGWHDWAEKHKDSIVHMGGPLGKTKRAAPKGIEDVNNNMGGVVIVKADSHEAAAKMFENHPHFTLFPGESVEIMPILQIPSAA